MGALFYIIGVAICAAVLLQLMLWTTGTLASLKHNRQRLEASTQLVREQIESARTERNEQVENAGGWNGYRAFYVEKLEKAALGITSVYFKPVDQKPIPTFQSGQHLPLKFNVPGERKPLIRCYSLSSVPRQDSYRISVKSVAPPTNNSNIPPGRVSHFINNQLMVGDIVEAKAPSGSFTLSEHGNSPIVLLAGGIGITPIFSMLEDLIATGTDRTIVLLYGVRFGREHAFREQIANISAQHNNVHVINCYSHPEPIDQASVDYQVSGWVSIDLIKQILPSSQCMFYLCGPPPFMNSLQSGLSEWGVPGNRIRHEAFGPATIKKSSLKPIPNSETKSTVEFVKSDKQLDWDSQFESVLELAEANDLALESGCRAGSCKTCAIELLSGKVQYPDSMDVDCDAGECLPCIAIPHGDVQFNV